MEFNDTFLFLGKIDVNPVKNIIKNSNLNWDEFTDRQIKYLVHSNTKTIPIIFDKNFNFHSFKIHLTNLYSLFEDEILKINVEVSTLDILFENQKFDLVKIDVQGAELDIINGGTKFLKSNNLLLVEVSLVEYNLGAPLVSDVVKRLENLGFYILDCIDDHISAGEVIQLDLLFSKNINAHNTDCVKEYTNVL
jgi:FkbM family methyltransferase